MATVYEWKVEEVQSCDTPDVEKGEIHSYEHYDNASDAIFAMRGDTSSPDRHFELCVVRSVGTNVSGMTDQAWAYVIDGKLPEYFVDGTGRWSADIPQFIQKEYLKAVRA